MDTIKKIIFPVLNVKLVDINKIIANDYNPNEIATPEYKLLQHSIAEDGYTQPIVCYYDKTKAMYIIVDGFHRYKCAKEIFKIPEIPVVVIDKPLRERIASTIRHNRSRGKHQIEPMVDIVASLFKKGWNDTEIGRNLGMDIDEVLRLKQASGLPELFKDHEYSKSWE